MSFSDQIINLIQHKAKFNFAVHCDTNEKAEELLKELHKVGYRWNVDVPLVNEDGSVTTKWEDKDMKTESCYNINSNSSILYRCRRKFYQKRDVEIFEYEDVIEKDFSYLIGDYDYSSVNEPGDPKPDDPFKRADYKAPEESKIISAIESPAISEEVAVEDKKVPIVKEEKSKKMPKKKQEVKKEVVEDNNDFIFCPECGTKLAANTKFCFNCGTKIEEVVPDIPVIESEPISKVIESYSGDDLENKDIPEICKYLDIEPMQAFCIVGKDHEYFDNRTMYRFNRNGVREKRVGDDVWYVTNNEQELAYIIEHPDYIYAAEFGSM